MNTRILQAAAATCFLSAMAFAQPGAGPGVGPGAGPGAGPGGRSGAEAPEGGRAGGSAAARQPVQPRQRVPSAEGVGGMGAERQRTIQVFPIGDLLVQNRDFPFESALTPVSDLGGRQGGNHLRGMGPGTAGGMAARSPEMSALEIVQLIQSLVSPDDWGVNGGDCTILQYGSSLVVSAPQEILEEIRQLLFKLRQQRSTTVPVRVELSFVTAEPEEVANLTGKGGQVPIVVDAAMLEKLANKTASYSATGFSGQVLHVASGQARQTITDVQPIVGTGAAAFQPMMTLVLGGVAAQFTATVGPEQTARLELRGSYSGPITAMPREGGSRPRRMHPGASPMGGPATGSAGAPAGMMAGVVEGEMPGIQGGAMEPETQPLPETIETNAYQFVATVRLELGQPVVVAQASLAPSSDSPGRQLLVIARVVAPR